MLETLARALLGGGVRHLWLVTRPADTRLLSFGSAHAKITAVVNPRPADGMLSSILAGVDAWLEQAGSATTPLLVCPVDHPLVQAETVARLLAAHTRSPRRIVVPTHQGHRGHPLLIPPALVSELSSLDPNRGLKQLLERHPRATLELTVTDSGVIENLNTPEDYSRARP